MAKTVGINPSEVERLHDVQDDAKLKTLIESMEDDGWVGAPVVLVDRDGEHPLAITGTHRLAAAEFVGIEVPAVQLRDLFAQAGKDYDALMADYLAGYGDLYDAVVRLVDELPIDVIDHHGLDIH